MKIAIGSDHAGLALKRELAAHLQAQGHELFDCGTYDESSCHYPVFAEAVCLRVLSDCDFGILTCGTGIGMSMCANKVRGIRAAAVSDCFSAHATRAHNNANVLCLGERTVGPGLACLIADTFLAASFEGGRHQTRVDLMMALENE